MVAAFTKAEQQNIWALETADLKLMRFRIMSIQENSDLSFNITALQHEPKKFSAIDFGADVIPDNITSITPDVIEAPSKVTITTRHRVVQGQTITTLVIDWSQVKEAVGYDVEWRKDDGNWIKIPRTGNTSVEIEGVYAGRYTAQVRSISAYDVASPSAFSTITEVKGKVGLPPNIVGLTVTGILFGFDLNWSFGAGSGDAAFTEIQVATAPNVNVKQLGLYAYNTNKLQINGLMGNLSQSFRARLVDKLGFTSAWGAWVTGITSASAAPIMDMIQGQINESSLNQALTSKIGKIDTNGSSISGINTELDKAKADIIAANGIIAANKLEAINAVAAANAGLATAKTDIIEAKRVADLAKTDSAANKTTIASLTTTVGNNKTSVDSSITTLTNKDLALSNLYTALKSEYDTNKASVTQDLTTLTNKDISLSSLLTALDTDYKGNKTAIRNELTAVSTKTDSTANSLTSLTTEVGKNKTAITTEATTRSTEDTALSNRITTVSGRTDNALSRITTAETTIANNTGAITQQKTDITAEYKQAIENIEVGGKNLFILKDCLINYAFAWSTGIAFLETDALLSGFIPVENGKNYISNFSISQLGLYGVNKNYIGFEENTGGRFKINNSDIAFIRISYRSFLNNHTKESVMIQEGNKSTAWTAAPEDVEAETKASVTAEALARSNADGALGNRITATDAIAKNAQARVGTVETSVANANNSIATLKTEVTAAFNASDNLVLDSNRKFNNATYLLADYQLAKIPEVGLTYKLTLKGVAGAGRQLIAYSDFGGFQLGTLSLDSDGNYTSIFKWGYTYGYTEERLKNLRIYQFEPNLTTVSSVDSIELVRYAAAEEIAETKVSISAESTARSTADTALGNRITATDAIAKNAQARVGTVETAVANANSSIATTEQQLTAKFNSINAPNTNLFLSSGMNTLDGIWTGNGTNLSIENKLLKVVFNFLSSTPGIQYTPKLILKKGTYTISVRVNMDGLPPSSFLTFYLLGSGNIAVPLERKSGMQTVSATFSVNDRPSDETIYILTSGQRINDAIYFDYVKLEEGTKATDWSMSPIDTGESFSLIKTIETATATNGNAIASTNQQIAARLDNLADNPNILVGGNVPVRNANYDLNRYAFTQTPVEGRTYHCVIKGELGTDRAYFYLFNTTGAIGLCIMNNDGNGYYSGTFKWTGYYGGVLQPSTHLIVYQFHDSGRSSSSISSITLREASSSELSQAAIQVEAVATASKITGLEAQYTVKLDVGGRVSGFGLASSAAQSDFAVNADRFYIAPPSGSAKGTSPFMVLTAPQTINGTTVPAGTYMRSAYIHNGSIDIAKINKASIVSLDALTANIGHFKSAPSGARLEIKDSLLSVYDANNKLRVRLGLW